MGTYSVHDWKAIAFYVRSYTIHLTSFMEIPSVGFEISCGQLNKQTNIPLSQENKQSETIHKVSPVPVDLIKEW